MELFRERTDFLFRFLFLFRVNRDGYVLYLLVYCTGGLDQRLTGGGTAASGFGHNCFALLSWVGVEWIGLD